MDETMFFFIIILFAFSIACIPGSFMFTGNPFKGDKELAIGHRFCLLLVFFSITAVIFALGELVLQYFYGRYFLRPFIIYGLLASLPSTMAFCLLLTQEV